MAAQSRRKRRITWATWLRIDADGKSPITFFTSLPSKKAVVVVQFVYGH